MRKKILITGGHSTPAFAVLNKLIEKTNYRYVWVGEKFNQKGTREPSAEYKTVTEHYKLKFINLKTGKLMRAWSIGTVHHGILQFFLIAWGFIRAFFIILSQRPSLVLSFGGFTAVPIVFWAWVFRRKVITHEQTIVSGLANRISARYANKILASWKNSIQFFPKDKVILTGNPIREEVFKIQSNITEKFDKNLPTIYITGGNQGAHEINSRIFLILSDLLEIANIVHQTGSSTVTNDYKRALEIQELLEEPYKSRYIVRDYVGPIEIGEILNKADVLISRAGANIIGEIIALSKRAVLIPIPWTSGNEQVKNAQMVEDIGLAVKLNQDDDLKPIEIFNAVIDGLDRKKNGVGYDGRPFSEVQKDATELIGLDSANTIADIIIDEFK